jgi:methyltransferase-like protein
MTACDVGLEEALSLPRENGDATTPMVCETPAGRITVTSPLSRAALYLLQEVWPGCMPFRALFEQARRRNHGTGTEQSDEQQEHTLARDLLTLHLQRLIRLWVAAPACVARATTYPCTTPLARWQASQGNLVTNRRHETHKLNDLEAAVLARLDGQHDRPALVSLLARELQRGEWVFATDGSAPRRTFDLAQLVEQTLHGLAQQALLIPSSWQ